MPQRIQTLLAVLLASDVGTLEEITVCGIVCNNKCIGLYLFNVCVKVIIFVNFYK